MIEAFKEEMNKSLKKILENTTKPVKEINKTVQDLKVEIKEIKKTQTEEILEMGKLGTIDTSITNRIQEMEERLFFPFLRFYLFTLCMMSTL
jgi:phage-related tail protein